MVELIEITDLNELMRWREEVIVNVFGEKAGEDLLRANCKYYKKHIADNTHLAIIAKCEGEESGCGSICLSDELPSPDNTSGKCAYLMNIYVREAYRKHGIAHHIVSHLIEEAKKRGCKKIYLETTEDGKPVYSSLGFKDMPDMMKYYDTEK